ncbi:MAG: hypothetical protein H0U53_10515, partial [Actinobacteria bacterium]|nr:hypothetical protein [Actinomycetota bacterium]
MRGDLEEETLGPPRVVSHRRSHFAIAATIVFAGCGGSGGGEAHPLGDAVTVGYHEATDTGARGVETMVELTVLEVREGSHA